MASQSSTTRSVAEANPSRGRYHLVATTLGCIGGTSVRVSEVMGTSMRILLIEDDADLRDEISEALVRRGHAILSVGSARAAHQSLTEQLSSGPLDAIVCDINLPDGDGICLYVEFAARLPSCRWILMSGDPDPRRIAEANEANPALPGCEIVEKPVSLRNLVGLLAVRKQEP